MTLYSDACKRRHYSQLWLLSHIYGLLSNLPFFRPFHFCNLTIMNGIGTSVTLRHPYLMPNLTILEIIFFFIWQNGANVLGVLNNNACLSYFWMQSSVEFVAWISIWITLGKLHALYHYYMHATQCLLGQGFHFALCRHFIWFRCWCSIIPNPIQSSDITLKWQNAGCRTNFSHNFLLSLA